MAVKRLTKKDWDDILTALVMAEADEWDGEGEAPDWWTLIVKVRERLNKCAS